MNINWQDSLSPQNSIMYANTNSKDRSGVPGWPPEQLKCLRAGMRHCVPGQVKHFYGLIYIKKIYFSNIVGIGL